MKYLLLTIFVMFSLNLSSQSLSINPQTSYYAEMGETCAAHFNVTNLSNEDLNVLVSRSMPDYDITTYFCWGATCYTPSSDISTISITIPAGQSFGGFTGYVQGIPEASTFLINYCFYPEDDPLERVCADVNFTSIALSIPEPETRGVYPNPAQDYLYIYGQELNDFVLYDLVGNLVLSEISVGTSRLDISDFEPGIYYYYLGSLDTKYEVKKLVISH